MILGIEIALAIYGLIALFGGKFTVSKSKVVVGVPARLLGLLALTPLPVAFGVILVYVATQAPANPERFADENKLTLALIEGGVVIGIAVLLFVIAAMIGGDPKQLERQSRRAEDDYGEDEPEGRDRDERDGRDRRSWER